MEIKENIHSFLNHFLRGKESTSIPKGAQWIITFLDLKEKILPAIQQAYKYEPVPWKMNEQAVLSILEEDFQGKRGCYFAQAISLPGEVIQTNAAGNIQSNALIKSRVGGGREDFGTLKITFLETNVSFVDSFLRGWSLATANFGMIARPENDPLQYRTSLICTKFGINADAPYITQQIIFDGICCTSVTNEEYNYTPLVGQPIMREAEFVYHSYSIDTTSAPAKTYSNPPIPLLKYDSSFYMGPQKRDKTKNFKIAEEKFKLKEDIQNLGPTIQTKIPTKL